MKKFKIQSFEASKVDRQYYNKEAQPMDLPSITTILCGNNGNFVTEAMIRGSEVHDAIANYFKTGKLTQLEDITAHEKLTSIILQLKKVIETNKLTTLDIPSIEVSRIGRITNLDTTEQLEFCGTCDLLLKSKESGDVVVIEFKTGKVADWHKIQLAMNMVLHSAKLGVLVYEDAIDSLEDSAVKFGELITNFWELLVANRDGLLRKGKALQDVSELSEVLDSLADLLIRKKDLEAQIDVVKSFVLAECESGKSFETERLLVSYRKPYTSYTLTKEAKSDLLSESPELFDKTETEGGYTFKLKK